MIEFGNHEEGGVQDDDLAGREWYHLSLGREWSRRERCPVELQIKCSGARTGLGNADSGVLNLIVI